MIESHGVSGFGASMAGAKRASVSRGLSRTALLSLLLAGAAMTLAAPVAAAGTLDLGGGTVARADFDNGGTDYDFVQHGILQITPTANLLYAGILRNGGAGQLLSVEKLGSFTLTLSGANTYTGNTTITAGTLAAGADNSFSAGSVLLNSAIVELGGYDQTIAGLTGGGNVLNSSGGAATLTIDIAAGTRGQTGNLLEVAGNTLSLVKTGSGTQNINGANNFTGGTTIANGILGFGGATSLGTGAITFDTGAVPGAVATLRAIGSNVILPNDIVLATDGTIDSAGRSPVFNGLISGNGKLTKAGNGFAQFNNAGNNYTGGTDLAKGELLLGGDDVLGSGTLTIVGSSRMNALTTQSLSNDIVLNANLTVDRTGSTLTLSGPISGGFGNNLAIYQGATLNLTHANTYIGNTYVTSSATDTSVLGIGDDLAVSGGAHQIIATSVDPAHPATLAALGNHVLPVGNTIRVNGALLLDTGAGTLGIDGKINDFNAANPGSLTIDGGGIATLNNVSNGYTLGTTVRNFSQLVVTNNAQLGGGSAGINLDFGYLTIAGVGFGATTRVITLTNFGVVNVQDAGAAVALGLVQGPGLLVKFGQGSLTLSGVNTHGGGTFVDEGTIDFNSNDSFSGGLIYLAPFAGITTSVNDLTLANEFNLDGGTISAGGANLTLNGSIGGTGALLKTGGGRFELNGANF